MFTLKEVLLPGPLLAFDTLSVPLHTLLEDEDGMVCLLTSPTIPEHIWNRAVASNVALIITPQLSGWDHLSSEDAHHTLPIPLDKVLFSSTPLSFRQYLQACARQEEQRKALRWQDNICQVHCHSEMSALDGLSTIAEMVALATQFNQPALAVTDHGVCSGHIDLIEKATKADLVPIAGIEAYFVDDNSLRRGGQNYSHLILWAQNDVGLKNLWALSTEANRNGFYYKPRMDWALLERYQEGIICSTACLRGPVSSLLLQDKHDEAAQVLGRLLNIFPDRLYVELHTNQLPAQLLVNPLLAKMAHAFSIPVIAAVDSHYPCKDDYGLHQLWLRAQLKSTKSQEDSTLFAGRQDYHMMTKGEVVHSLAYLPAGTVSEATQATLDLARRVSPYQLPRSESPIYSIQFGRTYATQRLVDLCMGNWKRKITQRTCTKPEAAYLERFEYEMQMLVDMKFTDYFMIVADYVRAAKAAGILAGHGRGSSCGSLVAFLADITEVDPIEYDLPLARFISRGRSDLPDFDVDFPASKRAWIQQYIADRWGEDHVIRVGTHIRLQNKGAMRDMARVLKDSMDISYADVDAICKIIDMEEADSAGLGKSWDTVMHSSEQALAPYVQKYPFLFEMAGQVAKRLKAYGKHAAGLVISTGESLTGRLPLRQGDEQMVAEFDFPALASMGLLKFDILTLSTLDTLQYCLDLIEQRHNFRVRIYDWEAEYADPTVWQDITDGNTLGVFQFETPGMTKLTKRFKPSNIRHLAAINALVRPGPQRSGLTEMFLRRREGREKVSYPHPLLEDLLGSTYGIIVYQEQVMSVCQVLAGYSDSEANNIRSMLGKKKVSEVDAKGQEFVARCVQNGIDHRVASDLWTQMAEFARYAFSINHSLPYAMIGYVCAWMKVHYPEEFFTAVLSTADKDRVPEFVRECQRLGFNVRPPDINISKKDFAPSNMAVRYGLLAIKGVGDKAVDAIIAAQPFHDYFEFRLKMQKTPCNIGTIKLLASAGALDSLYPHRKELEYRLDMEQKGILGQCVNYSSRAKNINDLPCLYKWEHEPIELTSRGRPKKRKDPPQRCTKACRHYEPQGFVLPQPIPPYTRFEKGQRESEMLGVWLSATPFDRLPAAAWDYLYTGHEVLEGPSGSYLMAGLLQKVKYHKDVTGASMAFLDVRTRDDDISMVVFSREWAKYKNMHLNALGLYEVKKTPRGLNMTYFMEVPTAPNTDPIVPAPYVDFSLSPPPTPSSVETLQESSLESPVES